MLSASIVGTKHGTYQIIVLIYIYIYIVWSYLHIITVIIDNEFNGINHKKSK